MKIDIHTHTRKCKSGDAATREITPQAFCETVLSTEVGIIAVTNHNVFDLDQYRLIVERMAGAAQVWPGVELDIVDGGSRGHLLVIVSPRLANSFSGLLNGLTSGIHPDKFTVTIDQVIETFEHLNPLYVAHYKQKKPAISDAVLDLLLAGIKRPECVIKEVTNSISAGIYISHGYPSMYGSDIHDWSKYVELSRDLPDLRLPVDSFEHFCLLLKKDPTTINTLLDRKTAEELELQPFDDETKIQLKIFNDINIIFGPKGTGKSCILKAIAKHYAEAGVDTNVYESASDRLDDLFDVKGKELTLNLNSFGVNYCTDEIEALRQAIEVSITSIENYTNYFKTTSTNNGAKKILIKEIDPEEETGAARTFAEYQDAAKKTAEFIKFLATDVCVKAELDAKDEADLHRILAGLEGRLRLSGWSRFTDWKAISWLNSAIKLIRREIQRKTGNPAKPTTTGFRDYALNRMNIEVKAAEILKSVDTKIPSQVRQIGSLGSNKGELEFVTTFQFQSGTVTDGALYSMGAIKKGAQKKFISSIRKIHRKAYADDLFQQIADLNAIDDGDEIKTVYELVLFKRYFSLNGQAYVPSSGESSMVMLQNELDIDKDIYILDEPERSLGNEYISDVIVPLIKERARSGKKVFISTHDANIAVRTLPYNSIYRRYDQDGYRTYIGNPFTNNLVNAADTSDRLEWKAISMKTLEGGEEAFGERGKIYGKN